MKDSKIEWTDHTFNPWEGCTKVSPGCANCYAEARNKRWAGGVNWGPGAPRRRTSEGNWKEPRKWDKESLNAWCAARGQGRSFITPRRPRVFCASLADWLDDEVPVEWLCDLLDLIRDTPNLDWLLLTKRPQNWETRLKDVCDIDGDSMAWSWLRGNPPPNVWAGTTIEDQQRANERIPDLQKIPAQVRFLSCEPLLGRVDLEVPRPGPDLGEPGEKICQPWLIQCEINWVICGGESGRHARPMDVEWARRLRDQCARNGVAFFFKQWGEFSPLGRVGKGAAGRLLDGVLHSQFPEPS